MARRAISLLVLGFGALRKSSSRFLQRHVSVSRRCHRVFASSLSEFRRNQVVDGGVSDFGATSERQLLQPDGASLSRDWAQNGGQHIRDLGTMVKDEDLQEWSVL